MLPECGGSVNRTCSPVLVQFYGHSHSGRSSAESRNLLLVRRLQVEKQIPHCVRNDFPARLNSLAARECTPHPWQTCVRVTMCLCGTDETWTARGLTSLCPPAIHRFGTVGQIGKRKRKRGQARALQISLLQVIILPAYHNFGVHPQSARLAQRLACLHELVHYRELVGALRLAFSALDAG